MLLGLLLVCYVAIPHIENLLEKLCDCCELQTVLLNSIQAHCYV